MTFTVDPEYGVFILFSLRMSDRNTVLYNFTLKSNEVVLVHPSRLIVTYQQWYMHHRSKVYTVLITEDALSLLIIV